MIERLEYLYALRMHERMGDFPDDLLRRHARRLERAEIGMAAVAASAPALP